MMPVIAARKNPAMLLGINLILQNHARVVR